MDKQHNFNLRLYINIMNELGSGKYIVKPKYVECDDPNIDVLGYEFTYCDYEPIVCANISHRPDFLVKIPSRKKLKINRFVEINQAKPNTINTEMLNETDRVSELLAECTKLSSDNMFIPDKIERRASDRELNLIVKNDGIRRTRSIKF